MKVKNTIRRSILLYPAIQQNVIDVLNQCLLTIGGGFRWEFGELVEAPNYKTNKVPTIEEALERVEKERLEDLEHEKILKDLASKREITPSLPNYNEWYDEQVSIIKDIDNRVNDRTLDYTLKRADQLSINGTRPRRSIFHLADGYSNITTIPVDVTEDWLEACEFMYKVLIENQELVEPNCIEELPKIKARIDWVKEQRRIKKEDIRPGMILQLYNKEENRKDRVIVLKVKEKHIKKGMNASCPGLYGFRGLWYGNHPENPRCYGKIYDLSTYKEDEIELIRPNTIGLNSNSIRKFITK